MAHRQQSLGASFGLGCHHLTLFSQQSNNSKESQVGVFFPNIIFLLWENCIMPPITFTSPFSHVHPTHLPERKKEKKKEKMSSPICVAHIPTHWSMVKLPVASLLNKTESFPTPTPARSHRLWRAISRSHPNPPGNNTTQTRVAQRAHHWALLYKIRKRIPLFSIWIVVWEKKYRSCKLFLCVSILLFEHVLIPTPQGWRSLLPSRTITVSFNTHKITLFQFWSVSKRNIPCNHNFHLMSTHH